MQELFQSTAPTSPHVDSTAYAQQKMPAMAEIRMGYALKDLGCLGVTETGRWRTVHSPSRSPIARHPLID